MAGLVTWFRLEFIPWTRGRMFRTGVSLDQPVAVTGRIGTWANGITLLRVLGLPAFVYFSAIRHAWLLSFVILGIVAVLDSIDGYIARRFNQSTRFGAVFDPLADRVTIATIGVTLYVIGVIPPLFVVLLLLREVLLLALVLILARLRRPVPGGRTPVSSLSKLAMMTLLLGLPFLLLTHARLPGAGVIHDLALLIVSCGIVMYYAALVPYAKAGFAGPADQRGRSDQARQL